MQVGFPWHQENHREKLLTQPVISKTPQFFHTYQIKSELHLYEWISREKRSLGLSPSLQEISDLYLHEVSIS